MKKLKNEREHLLTSMETFLEGPMIFLGFIWLALLITELIWGLNKPLELISFSIWIIFIIDFSLKYILAPLKIKFLERNWLTAISLLIPAIRIFRIFRFVRLLRGLRGIRLIRLISSLNRSMKSLSATISRRAFGYVFILTLIITFAGAAGMYAFEKPNQGFNSYGMALWWTAMRVITAGNEYFPSTPEGRGLAFLIAVYGYTIFGYVTATFASYFIGRDAEETEGPIVGSNDIKKLKKDLDILIKNVEQLRRDQHNSNTQSH